MRTRPLAALACLATVAVGDYAIKRRRPRWIVAGMFDHPAHVATAVLILLNLRAREPAWVTAYLAGSLLPDVDHIPAALRPVEPTLEEPRPVTHCLVAVVPFAGIARGAVAAGMLAHFLRDLGVGTGVPLLWPASGRPLQIPYSLYAAGCLLLAGRASLRNGL